MTRVLRGIHGGALALLGLVLIASCSSGQPEVNRPSPSVPPLADYGQLMAECLAEAGWTDATLDNGGVVIEGVPPEQQAIFRDDMLECEASLGYDSLPTRLSPEQLSKLYDAELATQRCLQGLGHQTTLPSRQEYIDRYYDADSFVSLYAQLVNLSRQDYEAAQEACPDASSVFDPFS